MVTNVFVKSREVLTFKQLTHTNARAHTHPLVSLQNDTTVTEVTERAETRSYLFRYDYGAFWMARPMAWSSSLTKGNMCVCVTTKVLDLR